MIRVEPLLIRERQAGAMLSKWHGIQSGLGEGTGTERGVRLRQNVS